VEDLVVENSSIGRWLSVLLAATAAPILSNVLTYVCLLPVCTERPKHSALLVTKQRTFFNEKKIEIEARRLPSQPQHSWRRSARDPRESRVDIFKEAEEEMEGNDEKESILRSQELMYRTRRKRICMATKQKLILRSQELMFKAR
jgi:hypothetical protein